MGAVQSIRPPGEVITLAAWHEHKGNVADLAVYTLENGRPDLVGEVVEHPDKFTDEYHAMRAAEAELEREAVLEQVGADIVLLSEMALKPWPGPEAA
jgi:hypothetical protein